MKTTIDSAGRLVIPKRLRDAAGLCPEQPLKISCQDGRIEIEPVPLAVQLAQVGKLTVARAKSKVSRLTFRQTQHTTQQIRAQKLR